MPCEACTYIWRPSAALALLHSWLQAVFLEAPGGDTEYTIQYRAAIGDFQNAATLGRGCASEYAESTPVPRLAGSGAEVSAKYHWGSRR